MQPAWLSIDKSQREDRGANVHSTCQFRLTVEPEGDQWPSVVRLSPLRSFNVSFGYGELGIRYQPQTTLN